MNVNSLAEAYVSFKINTALNLELDRLFGESIKIVYL
jgi:hypothetical protein